MGSNPTACSIFYIGGITTRESFIDDIYDFSGLLEFCRDNDLCALDYVYDYYGFVDYINENLMEWARDLDWSDLRYRLNQIEDRYEFYDVEDYCEGVGIDYDFDEYKQRVLEEADGREIWDVYEVEDEDIEPEPEESSEEDIDPESLLSILSLSSVA